MENVSINVGLCVLAFLIGRAVQRWADGTMEAEEGAYLVGYDDGVRDTQRGLNE